MTEVSIIRKQIYFALICLTKLDGTVMIMVVMVVMMMIHFTNDVLGSFD